MVLARLTEAALQGARLTCFLFDRNAVGRRTRPATKGDVVDELYVCMWRLCNPPALRLYDAFRLLKPSHYAGAPVAPLRAA